MNKIKNTTTKTIKNIDLHFWPAKINTKFDSAYNNFGYVPTNDFDSHMISFFFGNVDEKGDITLPELSPIQPKSYSQENFKNVEITLPFKEFSETYKKFTSNEDFDLLKCNYFLSDFNAIKPASEKGGFTYWFVDKWDCDIDIETGEVSQITFSLILDGAATFYNIWFNYSGVINVLRMHNRRWIPDNLFNTGKYIPDFQSNRFLQNCGVGCEDITSKFQRSQTTPMISSRHWNPETSLPIDSDYLKWDSISLDAKVKSKKLLILLWCMRVDQFEAANGTSDGKVAGEAFSVYQGDVTNLDGYSVPMKLLVYIPSADNGIPIQSELNDIIVQVQVTGVRGSNQTGTGQSQQYRIVNANICEDMWEDGTFVQSKDAAGTLIKNLYEPKVNQEQVMRYYAQEDRKEYFYFLDSQNFLWPSMFKTPQEITGVEKFNLTNYDVEPHIFTNKHFDTTISVFNKNAISFDISNLLINKLSEFYDKPIVWGGDETFYTFQLLVKKGAISPSMFDIKYYLLDNNTSVAYKRDNNVLYSEISGDYTWAFFDNTYNEQLRNSQNWRKAGLDNAEASYKAGRTSANLQLGKSIVGGVLGGATGGVGVGIKAGLKAGKLAGWGTAAGVIGGAGALGGGLFDKYSRMVELKTQKDNALRSINAEYEDAKNKPSNVNGGSPLTTQADIRFGIQKDDDFDPKNYKWLWTPSITFQQVLDYDCYTIAIDKNKNGYEQSRIIEINNFNDLLLRKFWGVVRLGNPDELFSQDSIQFDYIEDFIQAFLSPNGIRFWNLTTNSWEDIFNYTKHNYEKEFDKSIMTLEHEVYG